MEHSNYQPDLIVYNVRDGINKKEMCITIQRSGLGIVDKVIFKKGSSGYNAIITLSYWNMQGTWDARKILYSGKYIKLYYDKMHYLNIFAYNKMDIYPIIVDSMKGTASFDDMIEEQRKLVIIDNLMAELLITSGLDTPTLVKNNYISAVANDIRLSHVSSQNSIMSLVSESTMSDGYDTSYIEDLFSLCEHVIDPKHDCKNKKKKEEDNMKEEHQIDKFVNTYNYNIDLEKTISKVTTDKSCMESIMQRCSI